MDPGKVNIDEVGIGKVGIGRYMPCNLTDDLLLRAFGHRLVQCLLHQQGFDVLSCVTFALLPAKDIETLRLIGGRDGGHRYQRDPESNSIHPCHRQGKY